MIINLTKIRFHNLENTQHLHALVVICISTEASITPKAAVVIRVICGDSTSTKTDSNKLSPIWVLVIGNYAKQHPLKIVPISNYMEGGKQIQVLTKMKYLSSMLMIRH